MALTKNRWAAVPGTGAGTIAALGYPGGQLLAYSGLVVDSWSCALYLCGTGGHGDWFGNQTLKLRLRQASCAWEQVVAASAAGGGNEGFNADGDYADGSRRADHTYRIPVCVRPGVIYFDAMGAMSGATGYPSTMRWKWREADIANGRRGFTKLTRAYASNPYPNLSTVASLGVYDETTRYTWFISQNAWAAGALWATNTTTDALLGPYDGFNSYGQFASWATIVPRFNCLLLGTASNTIYRMDLWTRAWTNCAVAGSGLTGFAVGADYCAATDQVIGRTDSDGNSLRVLTLPTVKTGTYTWSVRAPVAGGVTLPATVGAIPTRSGVIQDMGDGTPAVVCVPTHTDAVYIWPIQGTL